jgi:hypothetical protein
MKAERLIAVLGGAKNNSWFIPDLTDLTVHKSKSMIIE